MTTALQLKDSIMKRIILALLVASSFSAVAGTNWSDLDGRYVNESDYAKDQQKQARQNDVFTGKVEATNQRIDEDRGRITNLENAPKPKDGKDGTNGIDGTNGSDGHNGIDGQNGNDGKEGSAGAAGSNGYNGLDGRNGRDFDPAFVNHANKQFSDLSTRIDDNKKKADAGSASAMAAAGVPQVLYNQDFAVGAAIGGYESEQAIAVGFSARASDNVTIKSTVAADTQQGFGYNAGVAIGW